MSAFALAVTPLEESERPWITVQLMETGLRSLAGTLGPDKVMVEEAGGHTITYTYAWDVRYGDSFYKVTVAGPHGDTLSRFLKGKYAYRRIAAYNPAQNWYAFEVLQDISGGTCSICIFDLSSGKLIDEFGPENGRVIAFNSWRWGPPEYIYTKYMNASVWPLYIRNPEAATSRPLCSNAAGTPRFTNDGRFLLLANTPDCTISLVETATGEVLDTVTHEDFGAGLRVGRAFQIVKFDDQTGRLIAALNVHSHTGEGVQYDSAVAIEIVHRP